MTQIFYIMIGLQGSGKSFYAKQLSQETGAQIICPDELRNTAHRTTGSWQEEEIWKEVEESILAWLDYTRSSIILDATNLYLWHRKPLIKMATDRHIPIVAVYMNTSPEICIARHLARITDPAHQGLTAEVIQSRYECFDLPNLNEGFSKIIEINPSS